MQTGGLSGRPGVNRTNLSCLSAIFEFQGRSETVNVLGIVVAINGNTPRISDVSRKDLPPIAVEGIALETTEEKQMCGGAAVVNMANVGEGDCLLLQDFTVCFEKGTGLPRLCRENKSKKPLGSWRVWKKDNEHCARGDATIGTGEWQRLEKLRQATTALHGTSSDNTESLPKRSILGRRMPLDARNGRDISHEPLQHRIWCFVKTEKGQFEFELLSRCQTKMGAGGVRYEDKDWGKGINPKADQAWLRFSTRNGWSGDFYKLEATACLEEKQEITAILSAKGRVSETDKKITRQMHGYLSDEFIRVPISMFPKRKRPAIELCRAVPLESTGKESSRRSTRAV